MRPDQYQYPNRLEIPKRLVLGGPENWNVLEVFTTPATKFIDDKITRQQIEVALLQPKIFEGKRGFEMMLAQIHEKGLTTLAAEVIQLQHRECFTLSGTGWAGVYFETERPGLLKATQEYIELGHGEKINALAQQLKQHREILTTRPGYLPAWQKAAKELAPTVAAFYILD